MPAMVQQSPQMGSRSSMGAYPPGQPGLSPIDDLDVFAGQQQAFPPPSSAQPSQQMLTPLVLNGGIPGYEGSVTQMPPQTFGYPPQPNLNPDFSRPRAASYHHLHQLHQPYEELDPLSAPPLGSQSVSRPSAPFAQYSFPAPTKLSKTPIIQPVPPNVHVRRPSAIQLQQQNQPLYTSAPHAASEHPYEFPPAQVGTLPDQAFSFGTYQQGGAGREVEYLDSDGTERGVVLPIARHNSDTSEADSRWLGFAGVPTEAFPGQNGDGGYLVGPDEQPIPIGFQPDSRRPSA